MARKKDVVVTDVFDDKENFEPPDESPTKVIPDRYSAEWQAYILSCFFSEELVDGHPTVDGLRRVAQLEFGEVKQTYIKVIQTPTTANDKLAIVQFNIEFESGVSREDVAEASGYNTDKKFVNHLTATAATRAEGRVLRKVLGLRAYCAEEIVDTPAEDEDDPTKKIAASQIMFLDMLCSRNNIDAWAYINLGSMKFDKLSEVPYAKGKEMAKYLSDLQNDQSKIPPAIKGYKSDWKESVS